MGNFNWTIKHVMKGLNNEEVELTILTFYPH
jgi:hypothetical protein